MKVAVASSALKAVLCLLACSGSASASAGGGTRVRRGANDDDATKPIHKADRELEAQAGEPEPFQTGGTLANPEAAPLHGGGVMMPPYNVGGGGIAPDHWGLHYKTGSCTCAKDAYMKVQEEAKNVLKMVPLVVPGMPDADSVYEKLQLEINRLVDYAVCTLHYIDCGCDDGRYKFKVFNRYKVTTYQCCCDVDAIRDVIVEGIRTIGMSWELDHSLHLNEAKVHKKVTYGVYDRIVRSVRKSVGKIGEVYIPAPANEQCIDAICPDDSIYSPDFRPTDPVDYAECEGRNTTECVKVCTEEGDSVCLVSRMPGATPPVVCQTTGMECPPDHHCITAGPLGRRCVPICSVGLGTAGIAEGTGYPIFVPEEN